LGGGKKWSGEILLAYVIEPLIALWYVLQSDREISKGRAGNFIRY